jgi:predicted DNA-binding transcriptional regulator AlpA
MHELDAAQGAIIEYAKRQSAGSAFLSIDELSGVLNISVRTMRRLHARNEGPPRVKRSRRKMYAKADVAAWIASRAGVGHGK